MTSCAYEKIKNMIIRNELEPGQFFNETYLQELLGVGRTPVHEALLLLSAENLITIIPRKGIMVNPITIQTINDIFYIRKLLEPEAIRISYHRLDHEWLLKSRQLFLDIYEKKFTTLDAILEYENLDLDFHNTISKCLNNSYVNTIVDSYSSQLAIITVYTTSRCDRSVTVNLDHVYIIDALLEGDAEKAANLMLKHLNAAHRDVLENYGFSPSVYGSGTGI